MYAVLVGQGDSGEARLTRDRPPLRTWTSFVGGGREYVPCLVREQEKEGDLTPTSPFMNTRVLTVRRHAREAALLFD